MENNFKDFLSQVQTAYEVYPAKPLIGVKDLAEKLGLDFEKVLKEMNSIKILNHNLRELKCWVGDDDDVDPDSGSFEMNWYLKSQLVFYWMIQTEIYSEKIKNFKVDILLAIDQGYDYREYIYA